MPSHQTFAPFTDPSLEQSTDVVRTRASSGTTGYTRPDGWVAFPVPVRQPEDPESPTKPAETAPQDIDKGIVVSDLIDWDSTRAPINNVGKRILITADTGKVREAFVVMAKSDGDLIVACPKTNVFPMDFGVTVTDKDIVCELKRSPGSTGEDILQRYQNSNLVLRGLPTVGTFARKYNVICLSQCGKLLCVYCSAYGNLSIPVEIFDQFFVDENLDRTKTDNVDSASSKNSGSASTSATPAITEMSSASSTASSSIASTSAKIKTDTKLDERRERVIYDQHNLPYLMAFADYDGSRCKTQESVDVSIIGFSQKLFGANIPKSWVAAEQDFVRYSLSIDQQSIVIHNYARCMKINAYIIL